eukprot:GHVT01015663.1.p1 GENE.GHVT01015663.1~~GHVT01015663.1.p1  ORF type:complete len:129 (+),score=27.57 GHVT01015663.1:184-570(+)
MAAGAGPEAARGRATGVWLRAFAPSAAVAALPAVATCRGTLLLLRSHLRADGLPELHEATQEASQAAADVAALVHALLSRRVRTSHSSKGCSLARCPTVLPARRHSNGNMSQSNGAVLLGAIATTSLD